MLMWVVPGQDLRLPAGKVWFEASRDVLAVLEVDSWGLDTDVGENFLKWFGSAMSCYARQGF